MRKPNKNVYFFKKNIQSNLFGILTNNNANGGGDDNDDDNDDDFNDDGDGHDDDDGDDDGDDNNNDDSDDDDDDDDDDDGGGGGGCWTLRLQTLQTYSGCSRSLERCRVNVQSKRFKIAEQIISLISVEIPALTEYRW